MKKLVKTAFFIALLGIMVTEITLAKGATLPPGNPFYFVQDGVRSLRRAFTFNPLGKALLEIRLVNERRQDLEQELASGTDDAALETAFAAYADELAALRSQAKGFTDDRVLDGVMGIFIHHTLFFDDVRMRDEVRQSAEHTDTVQAIEKNISDLIRMLFEKPEVAATFRVRAVQAASYSLAPFKDLRVLDILVRLEQSGVSRELIKEIERAKDDVAVSVIMRVQENEDLGAAEIILGNNSTGIAVLDDVRARTNDLEARNALMGVRERVVRRTEESRLVSAGTVRAMIEYARSLGESGGALSEQVAYALSEAEKFSAAGEQIIAIQHAIAAAIGAQTQFIERTMTKDDLRQEVSIIKKRYDAVRVKPAGLDKRIAAVADVIGRMPTGEVLVVLREIKLALAEAGR